MRKIGGKGVLQRKIRSANECLEAGDLSNAEAWFEEVLVQNPDNKEALAGLGRIARLKKIHELESEGFSLMEQGQLVEAREKLQQALKLEPNNSRVAAGLRRVSQLQKDAEFSQEEEHAERALKISSKRGIERATHFVESFALGKRRTRRKNIDCLLVSGIVHMILVALLSLIIVDARRKEIESISIEWVTNVPAPKRPISPAEIKYRTKLVAGERTMAERTAKSAVDQASVSNLQSPEMGLKARGLNTEAGGDTMPHMFSAVDTPIATEGMAFSPRDTMATGAGARKPGASGRSGLGKGAGAEGLGIGGLESFQSFEGAGGGLPAIDLIGGIGASGLAGPDPMDMVFAIITGRSEAPETVVFMLDISNSMAGNYRRSIYSREWFKKLKHAKRSIISSLYKLRPEKDSFHLMTFSSGIAMFHNELLTVNDSRLTEAAKFVQDLQPAGHGERTNLYDALMSALEMEPTRIILVSDGFPTEGVVSVRNILAGVKRQNKGARIYTFSTNLDRVREARLLLSKLAKDNSGKFHNVKMGTPRGLAMNSAGHLYVSDSTVRIFDKTGERIKDFGTQTIKLDIGPSDDVHLLFYPGLTQVGFGILGISRSDGTQMKSFASYGHLARQVLEPWDIAADSKGNTYVVGTRSNKITVFDKDGDFVYSFGSAGMRAAEVVSERGDNLRRSKGITRYGVNSDEPGYFAHPMGVSLDARDNIYVLDTGNRRVQIFSPRFEFTDTFPINGWGISIHVDAEANYVYVLTGSGSTGGDRVCIYKSNGNLVEKFHVGSGSADVYVGANGEIYVLNFVNDEVNIFSNKGEKLRSFSTL